MRYKSATPMKYHKAIKAWTIIAFVENKTWKMSDGYGAKIASGENKIGLHGINFTFAQKQFCVNAF